MTLPLAPNFIAAPQSPAGLAWQSIAIDRSRAFGAAVNLNTISRGQGGGVTTVTRWTAGTGAGAEAAALRDGTLCNTFAGVRWRALDYSLPLRTLALGVGNIGVCGDTIILDTLIDASANNADTGVFLMQWDGTVATLALPGAGGPGIGFRPQGADVQSWCSNLGVLATTPKLNNTLARCQLIIRTARNSTVAEPNAPGTFEMYVNSIRTASGLLNNAVGNGPNQGYAVGMSAYAPVVSAGAGTTLFFADLAILNTQQGLL